MKKDSKYSSWKYEDEFIEEETKKYVYNPLANSVIDKIQRKVELRNPSSRPREFTEKEKKIAAEVLQKWLKMYMIRKKYLESRKQFDTVAQFPLN